MTQVCSTGSGGRKVSPLSGSATGEPAAHGPAATRETYVTELMLTALDQTGDRTAALTRFAQSVSGVEADVLRDALDVF